jgi:hypothetical protein
MVVRYRLLQTKETMKTRTDLLNHLVEKYNLQRYLEIGVQDPRQNFNNIKIRAKQSVDPDPNAGAIWCETSDSFFSHWKAIETLETTCKGSGEREFRAADRRFDLIFIDGLHTAEQVQKDFENALKILSPVGFIVLHDCNPEKEEHTIVPRPTVTGHWNGDVYKFASKIMYKKYTIDIDNGCMVIPYFEWDKNPRIPKYDETPGWKYFSEHRKQLLNLISWDEFVKL